MTPPQDAAVLLRGQRLRATVNSEGWGDVLAISSAIVSEALKEVDAYPGTNEHEIATLTFIWKTLKAHHEKLLNSIQAAINAGDEVLHSRNQPKEQDTGEESIISSTAVKPLCDIVQPASQADQQPEPTAEDYDQST